MPMLVLREIKEIVNGYDTVRLRSFTVSIRYKTPDRIVFVKLEKTVKYGPFTVWIQYGVIRTENGPNYTVYGRKNSVFTRFTVRFRTVIDAVLIDLGRHLGKYAVFNHLTVKFFVTIW